ncbi:MAG: DEAD/DEAH box helicase family protein, partial [Clostridia bacterium]|nr:DEAD/DEAH box helicase family protein [Clostridia bacterium]
MARRIIGELIESGELSEKAKNISFDDGILYEHNQQPYIKLVDAIEKDGKGCAIHATGSGKRYLAAKWLNDNPHEPFVYIAPTNIILNQFVDTIVDIYFDKKQAEKIKKLALEDEIKYLEKELGFDLHLYTYAKIHRMSSEEMEKVNASHIVLDEFHRCGADKWGKSVNEFLRINSKAKVMGLSATPIRPSDGKNMVEEMFDGKIASELTLVDALEQNILPLPVMINAIYSFEDEIVSLQSRLFNKKYDPEKQKEIDKTLKQVKQLIGQSGGVRAIFEDFVEELTRNKGKQDIKMVVFCKDIADRDRKMDECKLWFPQGTKIKKYSVTSKESEKLIEVEDDIEESSKSKKLRQKVIKTFEEDNSKGIKLLFAVDMLNEGLHVRNLDGVIMLRDTSSNIVFLQQLGRALAVDKDRTIPPLVFDLVNNIEVLGEDIEEYREIIKRLTENGKLPERL